LTVRPKIENEETLRRDMSLVGRPAPDFHSLKSTKNPVKLDAPVSLDDYAGRWLVLLFYPGDFNYVCASEMLAFSRSAPDFEDLGADLLAISTDGVGTHQRWLDTELGRLNFPLASDPELACARHYGVLLDDEVQRGLFIIDPHGIVRYEVVHGIHTGRSVEEVSRVLKALVGDVHCPANWHPGEPALLAV
jgi:peroxiredoxin (alkyl hydroperoxide reductase subunit C)